MCFSAEASFAAGGLLIAGGVVSTVKLKPARKSLALASIPIIFGIHQLSEGVVWRGEPRASRRRDVFF
jgi:hypothetical protein